MFFHYRRQSNFWLNEKSFQNAHQSYPPVCLELTFWQAFPPRILPFGQSSAARVESWQQIWHWGPYSWLPALSSLLSTLGSPTLPCANAPIGQSRFVHKHVSTWMNPRTCEQRGGLTSDPITSYRATAWGKRGGSQPVVCLPLASPTLGSAKSEEPMLTHEVALKKLPLLAGLQLPCLSKEHVRRGRSNSCYWFTLAVCSVLHVHYLIWSQQRSHPPKGKPWVGWVGVAQKQTLRQNWKARSWFERWS